ncbi:MAG: DUF368 domain-containing protein, partial [Fusobacteriaceae bacterium]
KGLGIGVANIMPGVSGGTLAVVFNIYDKLVESVGGIFGSDKKRRVEFIKFLLPIFSGAAIGILLFAKILQYLYINYPKITGFGFLLLIIPSIPLIVKGEKWSKKNILSLVIGFVFTVIFILLGLKFGVKGESLRIEKLFTINYGIKIFLAGTIAAGAMIIPGISGSLLLIMLGEYYNILFTINGAVKNFITLLKDFSLSGTLSLFLSDNFLILYVFGSGVLLGIIGFSKFIDYLLKKERGVTLFFIDGVVMASVIQILLNIFY